MSHSLQIPMDVCLTLTNNKLLDQFQHWYTAAKKCFTLQIDASDTCHPNNLCLLTTRDAISLATANTQPITSRDVPLGSDPIDKLDNLWTINYEFLAIFLMQIVRIKRLSPSKPFPEFFKDSENGKDISMDN